MNIEIRLLEGNDDILWVNAPEQSPTLLSVSQNENSEIYCELGRLLKIADCSIDGGFRSRGMEPRSLARMLANELDRNKENLPPRSAPPTITVPEDLADALKLENPTVLISRFIDLYKTS